MLSPSLLLLSATLATAQPQPALLLDLQEHPRAQVEALAQRVEAAGGWWLELESQLLIAAPATTLDALADGYQVEQRLPALTPASLALQARGCGVAPAMQLPAIAMAGRFALVWAPRRFVSYAAPDSSEWRSVRPNEVLARDQSLRGPDGVVKGGTDPNIQAAVNAVDAQRWFSAVEDLSGFNRSSFGSGIDDARDWLVARFGEAGLSVELQPFSFVYSSVPASVDNVIARLPGGDLAHEWIVIGGHYDSRNTGITNTSNTPGAEDNASGCSGVLELARVFARFQQRRTLVFVCFAGEEQNLIGGNAFAQKLLTDGDLDKVKLAVIMDMIGYSGDTDLDVLLETSSALSSVFARYVALEPLYAPELRLVTSINPCCSDHMPFINRSVPSLLTIENDWSSYSHYHTTQDIPANMTRAQDMGGAILKLNTAVIAEAAGTTQTLFANGFE